MVTASDGSPTLVTSQPLRRPPATPTRSTTGTIVSNAQPASQRAPVSALPRPSMEATDRSTCPATTRRVIGSAMIATSAMSWKANARFSAEPKPSVVPSPTTRTATSRTPTAVSQRSARPRAREDLVAARGEGAALVSGAVVMTGVPLPQCGGHPQVHDPVDADGQQEEGTGDGALPEGVHLQHDQDTADGGEQQGAERRAPDGSGAAGDGDTAHDHGTDDGQLPAVRVVRDDRAETGEPQGPRETGHGPGEGVRREHPAADRDTGEAGGLGARPDGVQLASRTVGAQEVRRRREQDERDQRQVGNAQDAAAAEAQDRLGHLRGADLLALRPPGVDALDDVEHAQGHDERRDPAEADEGAGHQSADHADGDAEEHHRQDPVVGPRHELAAGEGGEAHHRSDREVDVPGDHHGGLADREQYQDRGVEQQVLDALVGQEERVGQVGAEDQQDQRPGDGDLAGPEDRVHERGRTAFRRLRRVRGALDGGGHAAALPLRPVAAAMTDSSVAPPRGISATRRPSCITSTRSAMPMTSGRSEEIISTARPSAASEDSRRWTSALVPTSIPRVGSSTISTAGPVASRLYLSWRRTAQSAARSCSRARLTSPRLRTSPRPVSPMLRSIDISMTRPRCRRSSGTSASPASIAAVGEPG